jgi:hypothetical protein
VYGQAAPTPQAWDFCSWGGNVIATNFEDEVQILDLESGATAFTDLITGGDISNPQAKFCDIVQNHLVLANINHASYEAYTVLWSHINDPSSFSVADYVNLSDVQNVRQTPGEITGFIGGEYGTFFKRQSIHRMSWVGGNLIFRFDTIARGIGTAAPKSIVVVNKDIYFWGHNGFYVLKDGQQVIPISAGKIDQMLIEPQRDYRSLSTETYDDQVRYDLNIVGSYDHYSGLIFWTISDYRLRQVSGKESTQKEAIIVYSPKDGRWGYIRDPIFKDDTTKGISSLVCTPSLQTSSYYMLQNLFMFAYDTTGTDTMELYQFLDIETDDYILETKVISTAAIAQDVGRVATLNRIRPIYSRVSPEFYYTDDNFSSFNPPYEVKVWSSNDPLMIDDVQTETALSTQEDNNNWASMPRPLSGEFWKFQIKIPTYQNVILPSPPPAPVYSAELGTIKNIISFQVDMEPGGTH